MKTASFFLAFFSSLLAFSQSPTQTVRGSVFDNESQFPLTGVKVEIIIENEELSRFRIATDFNGEFVIDNVPVGKHTLIASYSMYIKNSKTIEVNGNTVENPDYDPKQAALFAPTTTSPIGSGVMMNKLTQNYSKKELQEMAQGYKDDKGFYDEAFYDQFYTP